MTKQTGSTNTLCRHQNRDKIITLFFIVYTYISVENHWCVKNI